MKIVKWGLLALVVLFVGAQFIRPTLTNPPVDPTLTVQAHVDVPSDVQDIFERACYDCHSNETVYPWYSHVAPVSWLVAHDVNDGRDELSFSTWGTYELRRALHKLEEVCEMMESEEMPPWFYVIMHGEARLSDADRDTLCNWATAERSRLRESAAGEEMAPMDSTMTPADTTAGTAETP